MNLSEQLINKRMNSLCIRLLIIILASILPVRGTPDIDDVDSKAQLSKKDWIRVGYKFLQCHQSAETCYRSAKQAMFLGLLDDLKLTWDKSEMIFNEGDISIFSRSNEPPTIVVPNPAGGVPLYPRYMDDVEVTLKFPYPVSKGTTSPNPKSDLPVNKDTASLKHDSKRPDMMFLLIEKEEDEFSQHTEVTYSTNNTMLFNETSSKDYLLMAITQEGLAAEIVITTNVSTFYAIFSYIPLILVVAAIIFGGIWLCVKAKEIIQNWHAHNE